MHESTYYRPTIAAAAKLFGLDADVVEAIVRVESSGLPHAYRFEPAFWERYLKDDPRYNRQSPRRVSASYGLMQVMYPTAVDHGFKGEPEELFVPAVGLRWGCQVLSRNLKLRDDDLDLALAAYNGGLNRARKPIPPDLARYVARVKATLDRIRQGQ